MELFRSSIFRNIMSSSQLPFCDFYKTNHHETQVSRYGDESDFYSSELSCNETIYEYAESDEEENVSLEINDENDNLYSNNEDILSREEEEAAKVWKWDESVYQADTADPKTLGWILV